jgi:hypothetical protein
MLLAYPVKRSLKTVPPRFTKAQLTANLRTNGTWVLHLRRNLIRILYPSAEGSFQNNLVARVVVTMKNVTG